MGTGGAIVVGTGGGDVERVGPWYLDLVGGGGAVVVKTLVVV